MGRSHRRTLRTTLGLIGCAIFLPWKYQSHELDNRVYRKMEASQSGSDFIKRTHRLDVLYGHPEGIGGEACGGMSKRQSLQQHLHPRHRSGGICGKSNSDAEPLTARTFGAFSDSDRAAVTSAAHPVIILHGIGTPQRHLEPGEDVFWLTLEQFRDALDFIVGMGQDAPHITFDDGNASDIRIAFPELQKRNLKATFFILTGRLGQPGSLMEEDVVTLSQAGHGIGLHGHDHVDWRRLDTEKRTLEFVTARARLSALTGYPIETAAAPFGFYDKQILKDLRHLGFQALYTSDRGLARPEAFIRPRNCLEGNMPQSALRHALQGHVTALRKPRRLLGIAKKRLLPLRVRP